MDITQNKLRLRVQGTHDTARKGKKPMKHGGGEIKKSHKCDECGRNFNNAHALRRHELIHTGEKLFKCDVCSKCFSHSSTLLQHKRLHTGEKSFKCDVCTKTFTQSSTLNAHKRVHTGEKPFKCDVCKKTFTQSSSLLKHKRLHTAVKKPFNCEDCNENFSKKSSLKRHRLVHKEKPNNIEETTRLESVIDIKEETIALEEDFYMDSFLVPKNESEDYY